MITISDDFRKKVVQALLEARARFDGGDIPFSHSKGIAPSIFSRLKNGEIDKLIADGKWLNLGRELGVNIGEKKWNVARTDVFVTIEDDVLFCKENSKARIYVDECGIGKTFTAKYLSRTLTNCFYIDASQCKSKQLFVRAVAKAIGVPHKDAFVDVKENIKYYLRIMPEPIIIIDEAGDLEYSAFLELKALWNGSEGSCGWYLMGADGLRNQIEKGINNKKVGYREVFSRFSDSYSSAVPINRDDRLRFYNKLISEVLAANMDNTDALPTIVKKCLTIDQSNNSISGLRRAESLLLLEAKKAALHQSNN